MTSKCIDMKLIIKRVKTYHKLLWHTDRLDLIAEGKQCAPIEIDISPTNQCNHKCWFCYVNDVTGKKFTLPPERLISLMRELADAGVSGVVFQGTGEPLLNSGLADAIVAGSEAGLSIQLVTNGVLLNREFLDKTIEHMEIVSISAVESNRENYVKSHDCPDGHFDKVWENIRYFHELREQRKASNCSMGCRFHVFDYNQDTIYELAKKLKDIGVDLMQIKTIDESQCHSSKKVDYWPDVDEVNRAFDSVQGELVDDTFLASLIVYSMVKRHKKISDYMMADRCYSVKLCTFLDADGNLFPCGELWQNPDFCYGNILENSFKDIWFSEKTMQIQDRLLQPNNETMQNCKRCGLWRINDEADMYLNVKKHENLLM